MGVALVIAYASTSSAQPPGGGSESRSTVAREIEWPNSERTWQIVFAPSGEDSESSTSVLQTASGRVVDRVELFDVVSPRDYDLRLQVGRLRATSDGAVLLLATFAPRASARSSPTRPTLQVAWHAMRPDSDEWRWHRVGRASHTPIDGGQRFEMRSSASGDGASLVRETVGSEQHFCRSSDQPRPFVERYDPERRSFVEVVDVEPHVEGATPLRAKLPDEPLRGPFSRHVYRWTRAVSSPFSPREPSERAEALGDRRGTTAWRWSAAEPSPRAYATARIAEAVPLRGLRLVPGDLSSSETFEQASMPDRLLVTLSNGSSFVVDWSDELERGALVEARGLVVPFPEPVRTHCLSIVPLGDSDASSTPVALSEVTPVSSIDAPSREATARRLIERVETTPDRARRRRLARIGTALGPSLANSLDERLASMPSHRRERLIPLIASLSDEHALPLLLDLFESVEMGTPGHDAVQQALAERGPNASTWVADWLDELELASPLRIEALRLLGAWGDSEALERYIDDLGRGPRALRRARVRAMARGGESLLTPLFERLHASHDRAHRRDTLLTIGYIGRQIEGTPPYEHSTSDVLLDVLRETTERRLSMLTLRAAGLFQPEGFVSVVETQFLQRDDPLVRREAVRALRDVTSERARALIVECLRDDSPDVRLAAIGALEARSDRREALGAVLDYLQRSKWETGWRRALAIAAEVDDPRTEQVFRDIFERAEARPELARLAAEALARAERSIEPARARRLVSNRALPRRLRLATIERLGFGTTDEGERALLTWSTERGASSVAETRDYRLAVQHRAASALGRRRTERSRTRLMEMLRESPQTTIRRHALRALARSRSRELLEPLRAQRSEVSSPLRPDLERTIRRIQRRIETEDDDRRSQSVE